MDAGQLALVAVVGLVAGVVNTIAGGASLVTLPALIFLGLPAAVANGTNRVGVFLQSVAATAQFHRGGLIDWALGWRLLLSTSAGAALGAWLSVDIDETLFRRIIGLAMLVMLGVVLFRPRRWVEGRPEVPAHARWSSPLVFFAIGVYGGFLQAGVGIFLLAGMVLLEGRDLLKANAVKVLLVAGFTVPPLLIFVWSDLVAWLPGLVLAAGSALGGWLGARVSAARGARFIRHVLVLVVAASASKLLGLW